jgi:hypothetical protein
MRKERKGRQMRQWLAVAEGNVAIADSAYFATFADK